MTQPVIKPPILRYPKLQAEHISRLIRMLYTLKGHGNFIADLVTPLIEGKSPDEIARIITRYYSHVTNFQVSIAMALESEDALTQAAARLLQTPKTKVEVELPTPQTEPA